MEVIRETRYPMKKPYLHEGEEIIIRVYANGIKTHAVVSKGQEGPQMQVTECGAREVSLEDIMAAT